ncbi:hypothetical protein PR048_019898 [Dryococelus australis]|uniref:Uncharacterized protein n=1 Tax=Dryococelus australis TaxID=614101 RepID=A0ABQ9H4S4_9NEOP|nr:hypothetical protein PR048_019898 [Dryococelus australis]
MESLITQCSGHESIENWSNYVEKVKNIGEELWRADELQDDEERFLISLVSSTSSQSSPPPQPHSSGQPCATIMEGVSTLVSGSDSD